MLAVSFSSNFMVLPAPGDRRSWWRLAAETKNASWILRVITHGRGEEHETEEAEHFEGLKERASKVRKRVSFRKPGARRHRARGCTLLRLRRVIGSCSLVSAQRPHLAPRPLPTPPPGFPPPPAAPRPLSRSRWADRPRCRAAGQPPRQQWTAQLRPWAQPQNRRSPALPPTVRLHVDGVPDFREDCPRA